MTTLDTKLSGRLLHSFAFQTGRPDDLALRDLLTGLMHHSRDTGLDFDSELRTALENYAWESREYANAS